MTNNGNARFRFNKPSKAHIHSYNAISPDLKLIRFAYNELEPDDREVIDNNMKLLVAGIRGLGSNSALELQYKLGRWLNDHPEYLKEPENDVRPQG